MMGDRERFEQLLPFYVNRTLPPDDVAFVEQWLATDAKAQEDLAFVTHLQRAAHGMLALEPDAQKLNRFLDKLERAQASAVLESTPDVPVPAFQTLKGWWLGLAGLAVAATVATLVLVPGLAPTGALHADQLDGRADIELVLAQSVTPDHEAVVAHLQRFNGQIVAQSEQDGRHRITVDLQNRAADQHELIAALEDAGHLEGFTILASR